MNVKSRLVSCSLLVLLLGAWILIPPWSASVRTRAGSAGREVGFVGFDWIWRDSPRVPTWFGDSAMERAWVGIHEFTIEWQAWLIELLVILLAFCSGLAWRHRIKPGRG